MNESVAHPPRFANLSCKKRCKMQQIRAAPAVFAACGRNPCAGPDGAGGAPREPDAPQRVSAETLPAAPDALGSSSPADRGVEGSRSVASISAWETFIGWWQAARWPFG
jgi:hypothetical protein